MRINVDVDRCMGHGMCNAMAPEVYQVSAEGFNEMGEFEASVERREAVLRGANACPERIITVHDGDAG